MKAAVLNFLRDEEGATAIEYGLIAALIAVVAIGGMTGIGKQLKAVFDDITTKLGGTVSAGT